MEDGNDGSLAVDNSRQDKTNCADDEDEYREYEQCGFQIGCGEFKSRRWTCLIFNCCNNAKGALVFLSCIAFFQGFVMNGLINIVISTLERRFNLSSSETGLIASSYDIGTCAALLFVTYVGGRGHKPLWLGWGTLVMGIGSIIFSLPHFVAPDYVITGTVSCGNISDTACGATNLRAYRGFFILSQLLHGIGAAPLYTLALTYLDENVKQIYSSVYHGTFYALSLIGPGLGYLLGGQLLNFYTNPGENFDITTDSVLWVGNWWIGFLIGGLCFFLLSIPILMYPRQLPGTDKYRQDRRKEMHQSDDAVAMSNDEDFGKTFKDFPRSFMIFLKNPTIVFITLAGAMDNGIVAGIATFGPKYLESMFTLAAADAAFIFGLLAIVSSAIGQIVGGVVVSKFNLTLRNMIFMCILCSIAAFGCLFVFLIKCENTPMAGVTVPYNGLNDSNCATSSRCSCGVELYDPICGTDNLTYASYCDAGCDQVNSTFFNNCVRVASSSEISGAGLANATKGKCVGTRCPNLEMFAIIVALGVLFIFLTAQPALQASLRAVPFHQRSFAIGIQWLVLRLLGSVPMPNILGAVLDSSCKLWGKQCDSCGSCKVYSNGDMSNHMTTVLGVTKGLSLIFFVIAWKSYKAPKEIEPSKIPEQSATISSDTGHPTSSQKVSSNPDLRKAALDVGDDHKINQAYDNPNFDP